MSQGQSAQGNPSAFRGRVLASSQDFATSATDVRGHHEVWYPASTRDVARAVVAAKTSKTFVRSGAHVTDEDQVDGTSGVVINLRELSAIVQHGREVIVEAGATVEALAEFLQGRNLALPLPDMPTRSVVSCVIHEASSWLEPGMGALSDHIETLQTVNPRGEVVAYHKQPDRSCLEQVRASSSIITSISFAPVSSDTLRVVRHTVPYPGDAALLSLAEALFADAHEGVGLALDAYHGPRELPLVCVTLAGEEGEAWTAALASADTAIDAWDDHIKAEVVRDAYAGAEVMELITDSPYRAAVDATIRTRKLSSLGAQTDGDVRSVLRTLDDLTKRAFLRADGKQTDADFRIFARLTSPAAGQAHLAGYAYTHRTMRGDAGAPNLRATPLHDPPHKALWSRATTSDTIPGFRGQVYDQDDRGYEERRHQYATSSYPTYATTPFLIAYPVDADDIAAALAFARAAGKRVVARSGGHQYSAKSSGGNDTIVLSMDHFDQVRISGNIAEVGPAVRLTHMAKAFNEAGITIPHGECPLVAIGGHAQTGGFGHLMRSFGLALDWVESFDIVLADGTIRTVTRSQSDQYGQFSQDEQLFWGVLGGNAGSFGIVTKYRFKCVRDVDYPNSYGYASTIHYRKDRYDDLMRQVQRWTDMIHEDDAASLQDVDFMMTVESRGRAPFPVMLVELVGANIGNPDGKLPLGHPFREIIDAAEHDAAFWERWFREEGHHDLSWLSNSFVRRWPMTTHDGREFKYPYHKRINSTTQRLSDTFIDGLVTELDDVVSHSKGVKLVFQMLIGGGNLRHSPRRPGTSLPRRDYLYCFVFDLFYKPGYEEEALERQARMQRLIDSQFSPHDASSGAPLEERAFWGSFDNTDMRDPAIQRMYYDDEITYARLQQLKQRVDPGDLFHTSFTVPLP